MRFLFLIALLALGPWPCCAAPRTAENALWNVNVEPEGRDPSKYWGEWPGHQYYPSSEDWRLEPVYHLVTDRFRDGDPSNNELYAGGYNLRRFDTRHGGDFRGIEQKLDYIKGLGTTAIWISPIFQTEHNQYHGYGQIDFTLLDRRFGTLEDFRSLVKSAHKRGIYIFVDIVVNHLGNLYYFEGHQQSAAPFRFHQGEYRLHLRDPARQYADFRANNEFVSSGNYPPMYSYDGFIHEDLSGQGSFWNSDFHHNGALQNYADPFQIHFGKIYDHYDDLRLESERVESKIIAMTKALISSTDIDGIRIDTPMQVPLKFFKSWAPAVKAHAKSLGKNDFFLFGETFCKRPRAATMIGRGKTPDLYTKASAFIDSASAMDAGINYGFYGAFIDSGIAEQRHGAFRTLLDLLRLDLLSYDLFDPLHGETRYRMLNFFGSHDQRRLANWPDGERKVDLAAAIVALWPGVPLFYYGDEQGFSSSGRGIDGHTREDMMTSIAWKQHPAAKEPNPANADNFDMTNPRYLALSKVLNLKRQYSSFFQSDEITVHDIEGAEQIGALVFSRHAKSGELGPLIAVNRSSSTVTSSFSMARTLGIGSASYVNALDARESLQVGNDRKVVIGIPGYGVKIFVPKGIYRELDPYVLSVDPPHDSAVPSGDIVVKLRFNRAMNISSLAHSITINGKALTNDRLKSEDGATSFLFSTALREGINRIMILKGAQSLDGRALFSEFSSRIRSGTKGNVIFNRDINFDHIIDYTMVDLGATSSRTPIAKRKATFHHRAKGAEFFRISDDGERNWSPWFPFSETSSWQFKFGGWREITTQYWADGSAAYFVKSGVDIFDMQDQSARGDFLKPVTVPHVPTFSEK